MCPQSSVKVSLLNLSDEVKILDLWRGSMSLVKLDGIMGKINQTSIVH
jgi:hypothetical protein